MVWVQGTRFVYGGFGLKLRYIGLLGFVGDTAALFDSSESMPPDVNVVNRLMVAELAGAHLFKTGPIGRGRQPDLVLQVLPRAQQEAIRGHLSVQRELPRRRGYYRRAPQNRNSS